MSHHEIIRIAAAALIALQVWETLSGHGPLGGEPIAETGIVFGTSFVMAEIVDPIRQGTQMMIRSLKLMSFRPKKEPPPTSQNSLQILIEAPEENDEL